MATLPCFYSSSFVMYHKLQISSYIQAQFGIFRELGKEVEKITTDVTMSLKKNKGSEVRDADVTPGKMLRLLWKRLKFQWGPSLRVLQEEQSQIALPYRLQSLYLTLDFAHLFSNVFLSFASYKSSGSTRLMLHKCCGNRTLVL